MIVMEGGKSRRGRGGLLVPSALPAWAREMLLLLPFMALLSKGCMPWQLEWGGPADAVDEGEDSDLEDLF